MRAVSDKEQVEQAKEQVRRADQAKSILNNPLVKEYFIKAQAELFEKISKSKSSDIDLRERIYLELQQLDRFQEDFQKALVTGKMAENFLVKMANKASNLVRR